MITPMSFTYKKEVTEVKRQRSTTKKIQVLGKLTGIRIRGGLFQPARKLKTNGSLLATEKQEAFTKLRSSLDVVHGFLGEREKELVNDFGFFIRARRGNIIDQSLHLVKRERQTTMDQRSRKRGKGNLVRWASAWQQVYQQQRDAHKTFSRATQALS